MKRLTLVLVFLVRAAAAQDSLVMVFVGDIMQHESQMKSAYNPSTGTYDYSGTFDGVKPWIQSADIAVGNLEFTFGGRPYTGYPQFSAPDEFLASIKDAGFDVLVTANNHSVDRGRKGLERTLHLLDSAGISHTGTFADTLEFLNHYPLIVEAKGFRVSLLNYTYGTNGIAVRAPNRVNPIDTIQIAKDLARARLQSTDAIIVFMHWGDEYVQAPNEMQQRVAKFCLKHGARMVIGSHPHVLQPMIWDRDRDNLVAYSLGNFISGQRVRYRNGGALLHVTLRKEPDSNGSMKVKISDATYSLAWVSRANDSRRSFRLVPVGDPVDSLSVSGPNSRALFMEFVNDSRNFLDRENRAVVERARRRRN
ncbi:MAG: CapA family protein [Cyclobacteriaceae bacterium]|nr:CapA family protein [Cyclobacteriaceae bacterium]